MKYYRLHMVGSKGDGWICRCVDSMTKEDLLKYLKNTSIHTYECWEVPKKKGEQCDSYYIDCDTEEKADEMKNISCGKALWLSFKEGFEEFVILCIFLGVPIILLIASGAFRAFFIMIWLVGLVVSILFKSAS